MGLHVKKGKVVKMTTLLTLCLSLLVACSKDEDNSIDVLDKLSSKYDTTFELSKEYKPTTNKGDVETQKGIAKSKEGYYVEYTYNLDSGIVQDNFEQAKFNTDTSNTIGEYLNIAKEDYVLHSYLNNDNVLEVVIALNEGVEQNAEELQKIADAYLSPIAEISVYSVSEAAFKSLKKDFEEKGSLTNKTIKGYLFTDKEVYTTPFDVNMCFEDKDLSVTNRCIDYREALNIGEITVEEPVTSESGK